MSDERSRELERAYREGDHDAGWAWAHEVARYSDMGTVEIAKRLLRLERTVYALLTAGCVNASQSLDAVQDLYSRAVLPEDVVGYLQTGETLPSPAQCRHGNSQTRHQNSRGEWVDPCEICTRLKQASDAGNLFIVRVGQEYWPEWMQPHADILLDRRFPSPEIHVADVPGMPVTHRLGTVLDFEWGHRPNEDSPLVLDLFGTYDGNTNSPQRQAFSSTSIRLSRRPGLEHPVLRTVILTPTPHQYRSESGVYA